MNGSCLVLLIGAFTFVCDSIHYPISRNWHEPERAGALVLTWLFCLLFLPQKKSKCLSGTRTLNQCFRIIEVNTIVVVLFFASIFFFTFTFEGGTTPRASLTNDSSFQLRFTRYLLISLQLQQPITIKKPILSAASMLFRRYDNHKNDAPQPHYLPTPSHYPLF